MNTRLTDEVENPSEAIFHPHMVAVPAPGAGEDRVETAIENLLDSLGVDLATEEARETPRRVAAMYREMLTPEPFNFTTFENSDHYDELVLVRDIPFTSLCAHHLLPFTGHAHVAYIPEQEEFARTPLPVDARVRRRDRLGGLLHEYYEAAA